MKVRLEHAFGGTAEVTVLEHRGDTIHTLNGHFTLGHNKWRVVESQPEPVTIRFTWGEDIYVGVGNPNNNHVSAVSTTTQIVEMFKLSDLANYEVL